MTSRVWRWSVAVVLVIATAGCSGPVSRERLVGTYRVDYDYGLEQLTLKTDGTYTQEFAEPGQRFHVINQDRFDLGNGDFWDGQLLTLHNPVIVDELGKRSAWRASPVCGPCGFVLRGQGDPDF